MKKVFFMCLLSFFTITLLASNDKKCVDVVNLPDKAENFIFNNFPNVGVCKVFEDTEFRGRTYEVRLKNGVKIYFTIDGEWKEIDYGKNEVSNHLIPFHIKEKMLNRFPNNKIVKIKRCRKEIEVTLDNDVEVTFNKRHTIIDIDD